MAIRPDMVLQMAHHLADVFRQRGYAHIEVYAQDIVTLNGYDPQPLIDPDVDLAAQPRDLRPESWVLPRQQDQ